MNRLRTDLNNPSLTDNYTSLTSDVLLGGLQELPPDSFTSWRASDFSVRPIGLAAENVVAFEDTYLLEPAPSIPDEVNMRYLQIFFVDLSLLEKYNRFFVSFTGKSVTSPYTFVEGRLEQSPHKTRFSPDFFNIRKFVSGVMGKTFASSTKQKQLSKRKLTIPTSVSPQVIIESEEKNLTKELETAVRIAEESYSTLKAIDVNIEYDPEIVDRKTIRFILTVSDKPELVLKDEFKFKDKLYSTLDIKTCEQITTTYKWKS